MGPPIGGRNLASMFETLSVRTRIFDDFWHNLCTRRLPGPSPRIPPGKNYRVHSVCPIFTEDRPPETYGTNS